MFISIAQLERSLEALKEVHPFFGMSLLAFKRSKLPVGQSKDLVFSQIAEDVLSQYYRPCSAYPGYYNPFHTSDKSKRWLAPRYPSTSLQRITTDTFDDVLLHDKGTSTWGWRTDYVSRLQKHLRNGPLPAFDLAVWLLRDREWPIGTTRAKVRDAFVREFAFTDSELKRLFNLDVSKQASTDWLSPSAVLEAQLLALIGRPPGSQPEDGAALLSLELHHIGPATSFRYNPAERLNIITGDNSLGKTFLLECAWWALTGEWIDHPAQPRSTVGKRSPRIVSTVAVGRQGAESTTNRFDWNKQTWERPQRQNILPGFVVYARYDGSFAFWDPARLQMLRADVAANSKAHILFSRNQIWDGLNTAADGARPQWLCNGLIRDWVTWQTGKDRHAKLYDSLVACLRELSPSADEELKPGQPIRLAFDAREIPTVQMPYGDVPVIFASAGVQRVIAMAYVLVWAWNEHLANSALTRRSPQRRLVFMIDEVEAHLHPRWQRVIVPALMRVVSHLSSELTPQIHLATHSPMILASAETVFDEGLDDLHHLKQEGPEVVLEELPFVKRGRIDWWLMHDAFGLRQPRSLPAEEAIERAKALQAQVTPAPGKVKDAHAHLLQVLAGDDEFWPRWRSFALAHGAEK